MTSFVLLVLGIVHISHNYRRHTYLLIHHGSYGNTLVTSLDYEP
jgi:hypothetical protein